MLSGITSNREEEGNILTSEKRRERSRRGGRYVLKYLQSGEVLAIVSGRRAATKQYPGHRVNNGDK